MAVAAPDPTRFTDVADPRRRVGRRVEFVAEIGSTNDLARLLLERGEEDGIVVVTDHQVAGRGRHGRTWVSPAGRNLALSVALRPAIRPDEAWLLSAAAALAVRTAVLPYASLSVAWPNDLVAADGRKVAGILVETALDAERLRHVVVGIGINVNWRRAEMPGELASGATSLAELAAGEVDRSAVFAALVAVLDEEVRAIEAGRSPIDRYRAACATLGREVAAEAPDGEVRGRAAAIGDDGALVVETRDGPVTITSGEVLRLHGGRRT